MATTRVENENVMLLMWMRKKRIQQGRERKEKVSRGEDDAPEGRDAGV